MVGTDTLSFGKHSSQAMQASRSARKSSSASGYTIHMILGLLSLVYCEIYHANFWCCISHLSSDTARTYLKRTFRRPARALILQIHVGDWIDFIVWPRASQDCDGVYLVDMQMWEDDGLARQHEEEEHPTTEV